MFGDRITFGVDIFQNSLDILVLFDQGNGACGSNVLNRVAVIASQQNTEIDKLEYRIYNIRDISRVTSSIDNDHTIDCTHLFHGQAQPIQTLLERNLTDWHLLGFTEGQMAEQDGRSKSQCVHIF